MFLLAIFAFIAGGIATFMVCNFVNDHYKDENIKLQDLNHQITTENALLKMQINLDSVKQGRTTYQAPQFTQDDLKLLRNLTHPDKHKNSKNADKMFIKINNLIQ